MARQRIIAAGRVKHQIVVGFAQLTDHRVKLGHAGAIIDREGGAGQGDLAARLRLGAVFQIAI